MKDKKYIVHDGYIGVLVYYDYGFPIYRFKGGDCVGDGRCGFDTREVAEMYADETGLLSSMPDHLRMYFDFEAYGRDMDIEGHFIETDSGIVEIINY